MDRTLNVDTLRETMRSLTEDELHALRSLKHLGPYHFGEELHKPRAGYWGFSESDLKYLETLGLVVSSRKFWQSHARYRLSPTGMVIAGEFEEKIKRIFGSTVDKDHVGGVS